MYDTHSQTKKKEDIKQIGWHHTLDIFYIFFSLNHCQNESNITWNYETCNLKKTVDIHKDFFN
jgi:hypothetical protein